MTKQKLEEQLMDISAQMYYLAGSLQALCRVISESEVVNATETAPVDKAPEPEKVIEDKKPEVTAQPEKAPEPVAAIPLEKVRGVLADKSRGGHTEAVRAIINKYATRLSEIDPKFYPDVLREAEAL